MGDTVLWVLTVLGTLFAGLALGAWGERRYGTSLYVGELTTLRSLASRASIIIGQKIPDSITQQWMSHYQIYRDQYKR